METSQPVTDTTQFDLAKSLLALENQLKGGIGWFYWIAGLSLINTAIFLTGGSLTFVAGLGLTQIVDYFAYGFSLELSGTLAVIIRGMGAAVSVFFALLFILCGYFGRKRIRWVVIAGFIVYALDAVIVVAFGEWYSFLFHLLALFGLFRGFKAIKALNELEKAHAAGDISVIRTHLEQSAKIYGQVNPSIDPAKRKARMLRFTLFIVGLFSIPVIYLVIMILVNK
ncbi:MAG: hypothetical protein CVU39_25955 [Chloroflexi bacterium HGW-Chloroflexi-10]|nr:MAG: hypothetical protein CVU39_25955 [Chloroflexi bacterium HGW-Chloroflexi-10]